jgi:hypothetical protein
LVRIVVGIYEGTLAVIAEDPHGERVGEDSTA